MGERRTQPGGAKPSAPPELEGMSFEDALQELERIVKSLEGGQGTLAEAIADYERGAALRRFCEEKLREAEQKVQAIVDGPGGPTLRDVE